MEFTSCVFRQDSSFIFTLLDLFHLNHVSSLEYGALIVPGSNSCYNYDSESLSVVSKNKLRKIIVIDDDPYSLELIQAMLKDGFTIVTATSGTEGLQILEDNDFDLILLDWMMPGMDGLSVLVKLKSSERTRSIPVIFISGKTEAVAIRKAMASGATGYITKPFRKKELIEKITSVFESTN